LTRGGSASWENCNLLFVYWGVSCSRCQVGSRLFQTNDALTNAADVLKTWGPFGGTDGTELFRGTEGRGSAALGFASNGCCDTAHKRGGTKGEWVRHFMGGDCPKVCGSPCFQKNPANNHTQSGGDHRSCSSRANGVFFWVGFHLDADSGPRKHGKRGINNEHSRGGRSCKDRSVAGKGEKALAHAPGASDFCPEEKYIITHSRIPRGETRLHHARQSFQAKLRLSYTGGQGVPVFKHCGLDTDDKKGGRLCSGPGR